MKDLVIGIMAAADLTAAQVKSRLEAAGYTNVQGVKKEGDHFDAMATAKDGKQVSLDVDAKTGAITPGDREREERARSILVPASRGQASRAHRLPYACISRNSADIHAPLRSPKRPISY